MAVPSRPRPTAFFASDAPPRERPSNYPEPFASRMAGRTKRPLGDPFGLQNFGVNLTRLAPGANSSLHHVHGRQDEFIFVLEGTLALVTDRGETELSAGMCAGLAAGAGAHHLVNRSEFDVVLLEIGDRTPGDTVSYPRDDLRAVRTPAGAWSFEHKDGRPY